MGLYCTGVHLEHVAGLRVCDQLIPSALPALPFIPAEHALTPPPPANKRIGGRAYCKGGVRGEGEMGKEKGNCGLFT